MRSRLSPLSRTRSTDSDVTEVNVRFQDPRLRILQADDDDCFRLLFEKAFTSIPNHQTLYSLQAVSDGTDALDFVLGRGPYADRERYPAPDLLILDQRMRRMDGIDVLRALRASSPRRHTMAVIFSTSAQDSLLHAAVEVGAAFCIEKPLDFDQLEPKLNLLLRFATEVLELPLHRERPPAFATCESAAVANNG